MAILSFRRERQRVATLLLVLVSSGVTITSLLLLFVSFLSFLLQKQDDGHPLLRFSRGQGWPDSRSSVPSLLLFLERPSPLFEGAGIDNLSLSFRETEGGNPLLAVREARGGPPPSFSPESSGVTIISPLFLCLSLISFLLEKQDVEILCLDSQEAMGGHPLAHSSFLFLLFSF